MTQLGLERSGNEILYNGMTGEQVETEYLLVQHFIKG